MLSLIVGGGEKLWWGGGQASVCGQRGSALPTPLLGLGLPDWPLEIFVELSEASKDLRAQCLTPCLGGGENTPPSPPGYALSCLDPPPPSPMEPQSPEPESLGKAVASQQDQEMSQKLS